MQTARKVDRVDVDSARELFKEDKENAQAAQENNYLFFEKEFTHDQRGQAKVG